jgi:glutamate carboxypeptidase
MSTARGLLAITALAISTPAAAQLSPTEEVMLENVEAHREADIALLERLVNQNSGTHNHDGVKAVADMFAPEFEALGFEVEWIDQSHVGRAGHLFARHEGRPGSTRMLLIGHLDTVFEPDSPFQRFVREGDRATGPGTEDMKGGNVIILSALRAMKAAGTLDEANIVVALTGDEEDTGDPIEQARADLLAAGEWADVALGFESLSIVDGRDYGVVARRSSNSWRLKTTGKTGHSSGIFAKGQGYGAIYEMARILDTFRRELSEENLTYNVGLMVGGTPAEMSEDGLSANGSGKGNIIPPIAHASGDLRTISQEQSDRIAAAIDGNRALLARLNTINTDMGFEKMEEFPPSKRGAADISFVAPLVDAALAGMGPNGELGHAPGENVDLMSFTRQAQRAAILMSRMASEDWTGSI